MAYKPIVNEVSQNNMIVDTFYGYNAEKRIADGQFWKMENMSSRDFPLLSSRKERMLEDMTGVVGMCRRSVVLSGSVVPQDALCVLFKNKVRYYTTGESTTYEEYPISLIWPASVERQLVVSGSYMYIWPDKMRIHMAKPGTLEPLEKNTFVSNYQVTLALHKPGAGWVWPRYIQDSQPENPTDGQLWVDTSLVPHKIYEWNAEQETWVDITYDLSCAITMPEGTFDGFAAGDYVNISGFGTLTTSSVRKRTSTSQWGITQAELDGIKKLDGWHQIVEVDGATGTFISIREPIANCYYIKAADVNISASRPVPDMDYICEAQNRLWGCKYGYVNGELVNELYCSALGDARNWYKYSGDSTASWAASCGSDGPWTGAISYNGYPTFFKERSITKVYISAAGAHQTVETNYPGIENGSNKSAEIVNGQLYYKGVDGVYGYDGGYPALVSKALGSGRYCNAVACSNNGMYYVSMMEGSRFVEDDGSRYDLFVYDTSNGVWSREDEFNCFDMCEWNNCLLAYGFLPTGNEDDPWNSHLICIDPERFDNDIEGMTKEGQVEWFAESGIQYYGSNSSSRYKNSYPAVNWYVSRYNFRINLDEGAECRLLVSYDDEPWVLMGDIFGEGKLVTVTIPVPQARCDHLRYRLEGKGGVQLWMIARKQEEGSDER